MTIDTHLETTRHCKTSPQATARLLNNLDRQCPQHAGTAVDIRAARGAEFTRLTVEGPVGPWHPARSGGRPQNSPSCALTPHAADQAEQDWGLAIADRLPMLHSAFFLCCRAKAVAPWQR